MVSMRVFGLTKVCIGQRSYDMGSVYSIVHRQAAHMHRIEKYDNIKLSKKNIQFVFSIA